MVLRINRPRSATRGRVGRAVQERRDRTEPQRTRRPGLWLQWLWVRVPSVTPPLFLVDTAPGPDVFAAVPPACAVRPPAPATPSRFRPRAQGRSLPGARRQGATSLRPPAAAPSRLPAPGSCGRARPACLALRWAGSGRGCPSSPRATSGPARRGSRSGLEHHRSTTGAPQEHRSSTSGRPGMADADAESARAPHRASSSSATPSGQTGSLSRSGPSHGSSRPSPRRSATTPRRSAS
jgi:hypothetical protein